MCLLKLADSGFKNCTSAWLEQRDFTYLAIDALGKHPVVSDIVDALKETRAAFPDLIGDLCILKVLFFFKI